MSDSPDGNVPAAPCASVTTPSFFDAVIDFGSNSTRAAWYDADVKMWEPFKMWENGNKKEDELPSVAIIEKKTGEVLHIGFEARMMTVSSPQQVYKKSIKSDFGGNPNTRRGNAFQQFVSDVVRDFTNNLHTKLEKNQTFRLTTSTPVLWSRLHLNTFEYAIREGMKLGLDQGSEVDVHIIHEPACAGLARNIGSFMAHRSFQDGDRLCVCDFGGTTIDVCPVKKVQTSPKNKRPYRFCNRTGGTEGLPYGFNSVQEIWVKNIVSHHGEQIDPSKDEEWKVGLVRRAVESYSADWMKAQAKGGMVQWTEHQIKFSESCLEAVQKGREQFYEKVAKDVIDHVRSRVADCRAFVCSGGGAFDPGFRTKFEQLMTDSGLGVELIWPEEESDLSRDVLKGLQSFVNDGLPTLCAEWPYLVGLRHYGKDEQSGTARHDRTKISWCFGAGDEIGELLDGTVFDIKPTRSVGETNWTWEFDATAFISHCNPVGKNPRKPERVANNEIQVWKPETDCGIYFSYYDPHKSTQLKTVEVPLDLECDLKDGSGTAVIYAYIVPRGVSNYLWLFARKDGKEVQIPADDYGAGLIMRHGTWELSPDVRRQFEEGGLIKKTMLIDALVEDDALDSGRHAALEVPSSDRPKRRRRETAKATELKRKKLG